LPKIGGKSEESNIQSVRFETRFIRKKKLSAGGTRNRKKKTRTLIKARGEKKTMKSPVAKVFSSRKREKGMVFGSKHSSWLKRPGDPSPWNARKREVCVTTSYAALSLGT